MYGEIERMNNVAAQVIVCLGSTRARLVETPELLKVEWIQTRSGDALTASSELSRDSSVRDCCDDWAEGHGWNDDPRHRMQTTKSNARNDQITGQGRHSTRRVPQYHGATEAPCSGGWPAHRDNKQGQLPHPQR